MRGGLPVQPSFFRLFMHYLIDHLQRFRAGFCQTNELICRVLVRFFNDAICVRWIGSLQRSDEIFFLCATSKYRGLQANAVRDPFFKLESALIYCGSYSRFYCDVTL